MSGVIQRTKTYAVCPACGKDAGCVDHLLGRETVTWWYCDACGQRYRLAFSADGSVDISIAAGRLVRTLDVLKLDPQPKAVFFVVRGMRLEEGAPIEATETDDSAQFFYEEHSCPTNWLRPDVVYYDGDADPHGLITFVARRDESAFPLDEDAGPNDHDSAVVAFIEEHRLGR